ncbi:hypothetical protein KDK_26660 [Dictyobacter kobayashii]|uniref:3-keto-alpha-glucoside-1,2-lyase/3-keto-2-hydroxy-glucal hydratase domain-containing protein n=2 Tax=Dictyobacter kobayashii TaxID=2014872 RepID=A0A402AID6_9CHLR|nr:hypothetical protein KDK_26660 [Dictyobacter kobayashii]
MPIFPTEQQSARLSTPGQAAQQNKYFFPDEQSARQLPQGARSQNNLPLFPIERSPRGQLPQASVSAYPGQASPRTHQDNQFSQGNLPSFTAGQPTPTNMTPASLPKLPTGARPISQGSPVLQAAMQQASVDNANAAEKKQESSNQASNTSFAGAATPPITRTSLEQPARISQPLNTLNSLKTANLRNQEIEAKFAFNVEKKSEQPAGIMSLLRPRTILVLAVVLVIIIASTIGIAVLANNNTAQQVALEQTNATATSVSSQATATTTIARENARATQTAQVKAERADPYVTDNTSTLILDDPLTDNRNGWQEGADSTNITAGQCTFKGQSYTVNAPALEPTVCFQNKQTYSNFAYQVDMTITNIGQSFSGAGIVFRGNNDTKGYYFFEIYGSGNYSLQKCIGGVGCANPMDGYKLGKPPLTTFKQGLNMTNTLAVVADGNSITLYVNKEKVSTVTDQIGTPYDTGDIGVMATGGNDTGIDATTNTPTSVIFSHAKVWNLQK